MKLIYYQVCLSGYVEKNIYQRVVNRESRATDDNRHGDGGGVCENVPVKKETKSRGSVPKWLTKDDF